MWKRITVLFLIVFAAEVYVFAQTEQQLFEKMLNAFQTLKYDNAQQFARQITEKYDSHTRFELLEAHKILGIIAYQSDQKTNEATVQFEQALSLDQTTTLDSIYASPRTIQFFETLKSKFIAENKFDLSEKSVSYRYLIQPDPRPNATFRSMVLPGWGQIYKNDTRKGYLLITSSALTMITVGLFHVLQNNAHSDYLNATAPDDIQQKYDRYNQRYKIRNNAALLGGGVWIYAFFDALLVPPKTSKTKVTISFDISHHPSLIAQISF